MDVYVVYCTLKTKEQATTIKKKKTSTEKLQRENKRRNSENEKNPARRGIGCLSGVCCTVEAQKQARIRGIKGPRKESIGEGP
jgi:hypothetical protein